MEDISGFNWYKQEEAYKTFIYEDTKLMKKLDQYFELADPEVVIDLINDKMCSLLHAPDPDNQAGNRRQSEENLLTGHGVLAQLAREKQPKPLSDKAQAALVTLFKNLHLAHTNLAKVAKSAATLRKLADGDQFGFIM